jgi:urate oxidase
MTIQLGENEYGISRVRLLRVVRQNGRHDIKELSVGIRFEGEFAEAHAKGENRKILPPDTMKNTVYALARQYPVEAVEDFSLHLIDHFLTYNPQVARVRIEIEENLWSRIAHGGKPHAHAFTRAGGEKRTARLAGTREEVVVHAGIAHLVVLKTARVGYESFLRDPYTTQREEREGILSTSLRAEWLYGAGEIEYGPVWHGVRQALLETFAEHESRSMQHTLHAMGEAVLGSFDQIREIRLSLPHRLYTPVDLAPFGMDNPAEVFLPDDEPRGVVEAALRRE